MPKRQTWLISRKLLVIFVTIPTTSAILLPLLVIDRNFKPEFIFVTPIFHISFFGCKPTMINVRIYNSKAHNLTQKSHTQFMVDILSKFKTSLRFQRRLTWLISNSSEVKSVTTSTTSVIFFPLSKGDYSFLAFLLTYNHFHCLAQSAFGAASGRFLAPTSAQTENPWSIKVHCR